MTTENNQFSLSAVAALVSRINEKIDRQRYNVMPFNRYEEEENNPVAYAQSFTLGEEGEDVFADDHFIVWSGSNKIFSREDDLDKESHFFALLQDGTLRKVTVPMTIPKDLTESTLENEYASTEKPELKKSSVTFEDFEAPNRSLSGLENEEIQGIDSELIIAADVLKRRLNGKNMDATLKYAIINAKSPKKNAEALNFALSSCSRNYTHTAHHLMYALLDLYRHIIRQTERR